jgi:molecular chaperone GrpE
MTEETETGEETDVGDFSDDDKRFEVKWRKKNDASPSPSREAIDEPAVEQSSDVTSLQKELDSERERVRDLQDRWQRAAADLANLRRRTEQEKGDVEKFASMLLVQQLLPVLDNFDRALATIPGNLQMLTWIQGVMLIERHLRAILEQQGLQPIEAQGQPFNAHFHEAIGEREADEAPVETVLQEYQKGYTMHGQVIRPALVEVAKAPADVPPPPDVPLPDVARPSMAESPPPDVARPSVAEVPPPDVARPSVADPGPSDSTGQPESPNKSSNLEGKEIAEEAEAENSGP